MIRSNTETTNLLISIVILIITTTFMMATIMPSIVNEGLIEGRIISSGRYAITYEGYDSISNEDNDSVITIGTSILQYATDGKCISSKLETPDTNVYNMAIGGSNPYTEMIQIPALIKAKPELVIIDLGPNNLWEDRYFDSINEYIEFRFKILSISMTNDEIGEWFDLLREKDKQWIATDSIERTNLTQSYSHNAIEGQIAKLVDEYIDLGIKTAYEAFYVPELNSEEWINYLQTPGFMGYKFDIMDKKEVDLWFEENMYKHVGKGVFNPLSEGTLNHIALEYMISELSDSDIKIALVAVPFHPKLYDYLESGQIDGHNDTLTYFEDKYDVSESFEYNSVTYTGTHDNTTSVGWFNLLDDSKKNYVIDTSVFLSDADCIYKFGNADIFICLKVLEEIDKHKKRQDSVGVNARKIIRILDELRQTGNLHKGVRIGKGKGLIRAISYEILKDSTVLPPDLDLSVPDHVIIATAMAVDKETTAMARSLNMSKEEAIGVKKQFAEISA